MATVGWDGGKVSLARVADRVRANVCPGAVRLSSNQLSLSGRDGTAALPRWWGVTRLPFQVDLAA